MTSLYEFSSSMAGTGILRLASLDPRLQELAPASAPAKSILPEASLGDSLFPWRPGAPKAPLIAGLGALGSTAWYGLSYAGASSAPWQGIVGSFGAAVITAPFEAYENYTLYRQGKRSLSHSILDGVGDTLSAGAASYLGSSLASLIISSAVGRAAPVRGTLGASLLAAAIGIGACHLFSVIKQGLLKEAGVA